jgi:hypothetical protein
MSIEQALADNTAALTRNSDLLERVIAGQEAAMEKLNAGGASTRKPRAAKADPVVKPNRTRETRLATQPAVRTRRLGRKVPPLHLSRKSPRRPSPTSLVGSPPKPR